MQQIYYLLRLRSSTHIRHQYLREKRIEIPRRAVQKRERRPCLRVTNILRLKAIVRHRVLCSPARDYAFELEVTFCVRGVVSPLLANLFLNRMLKGWKQTKRGEQFQARIVSYADDFVILSRGHAQEALGWRC